MAEEVTYHLDEFDGPLDLLLHLIKVNEMDILDIPIVAITEQYLDFLHQAEERNLDIAGEFLVMAATLMSIKSTYLIPKNEELTYDQDLAEFVYEEDPREALMAQLLEYQRYQQAADDLREREEGRQLQFSRAPMAIPEDIEVAPLPEGLGLFDLQLAFNQMSLIVLLKRPCYRFSQHSKKIRRTQKPLNQPRPVERFFYLMLLDQQPCCPSCQHDTSHFVKVRLNAFNQGLFAFQNYLKMFAVI